MQTSPDDPTIQVVSFGEVCIELLAWVLKSLLACFWKQLNFMLCKYIKIKHKIWKKKIWKDGIIILIIIRVCSTMYISLLN